MKTGLCSFSSALTRRSLLVLVVDRQWRKDQALREVDSRTKGVIVTEARRRRFTGKAGEQAVVQTHGATVAPAVALLGTDPALGAAALAAIAGRVASLAASERCNRVSLRLPQPVTADSIRAVAEGVGLARYRFTQYRSKQAVRPALRLDFVIDDPTAAQRSALADAAIRCRAVCLARDLVNTPSGDLPPAILGERAAALASDNLDIRVHGPKQLERLKMGAILAVGKGSRHSPRLIEMRYDPPHAPPGHYALVGKGITFDSGGLSLKSSSSMELMKRDMAGGATVIAAMAGIAELGLPVRVRAYVPSAENMPDGNAVRPGDVVTACNGKTIEILNTDAEGRLVLADAIAYAVRAEPRTLVDFATLTGAVKIALGKRYAAVLGSDQDLVDRLLDAAAGGGEGLWQLPLASEYRRDIASDIADIKNTGAGGAGTITAALFLREFVGDTPWAHVDFSSTAMSDGYTCHPKGPSGYGVRTAIAFVENL